MQIVTLEIYSKSLHWHFFRSTFSFVSRDLDKVTNTWIPSKLGAKLTSRWIHPPYRALSFLQKQIMEHLHRVSFAPSPSPNDFQLEIYVLVYVKIVLKVFSFFRKKFVIRVSGSFEKFFRCLEFIYFSYCNFCNFFSLLLQLEESFFFDGRIKIKFHSFFCYIKILIKEVLQSKKKKRGRKKKVHVETYFSHFYFYLLLQ